VNGQSINHTILIFIISVGISGTRKNTNTRETMSSSSRQEEGMPLGVCGRCNKSIDVGTPFITAMDQELHEECFRCELCQRQLKAHEQFVPYVLSSTSKDVIANAQSG